MISKINKYVGQKKNCELEIMDTIHDEGLQNFGSQANTLNPVNILEMTNFGLLRLDIEIKVTGIRL